MFCALLQKCFIKVLRASVWFVWMRDGNHKSKSPLLFARWQFLRTPSFGLRVRWACLGCVAHNSSIAWSPSSIDRYEPDPFLRQSLGWCIHKTHIQVLASYDYRSHPWIGLDCDGFLCTTLGSCVDAPGRQTNRCAGPGLCCWTLFSLPYAFVKACKTFRCFTLSNTCPFIKTNRFSYLKG